MLLQKLKMVFRKRRSFVPEWRHQRTIRLISIFMNVFLSLLLAKKRQNPGPGDISRSHLYRDE